MKLEIYIKMIIVLAGKKTGGDNFGGAGNRSYGYHTTGAHRIITRVLISLFAYLAMLRNRICRHQVIPTR
jgi:hypothetical protein